MIVLNNDDSRSGLVFAAFLSMGAGWGAVMHPQFAVWQWLPLYAISLGVLASTFVTNKTESIEGWRLWLASAALVYGTFLGIAAYRCGPAF